MGFRMGIWDSADRYAYRHSNRNEYGDAHCHQHTHRHAYGYFHPNHYQYTNPDGNASHSGFGSPGLGTEWML